MKSNKAIGPDKINVELIMRLNELRIVKLPEMPNEVYDSDEIPANLSRQFSSISTCRRELL